MKFFLGVDGGQTTTKALLAGDNGEILARASGGPSNHTEEPGGPERLSRVMRGLIATLLAEAAAPANPNAEFAAACFGMTGETRIKERILREIVRTPHLSVVHDSVNALAGATAGGPGVIVIAGTGSVARGAGVGGLEIRAGGWGHVFGDEGSAYWIGREAVRAAAAEADGFGERSELPRLLLSRLGVGSAYELMERYYSGEFSRDHLAGLSLWVNEAATCGDLVATQILQAAGRQLAGLALDVISRLFGAKNVGSVKVCYTGGVFESRFVVSAFREALLSRHAQLRISRPDFSPVYGSLLLAFRLAGAVLGAEIKDGWKRAAAEAG